ncbi:unnamed protein product [Calicophoron daubneyi]|uniref:PB1 domain-containing protein n=1 Tax=Calicophoron daubneyi TaxID=300641 RepID=A0AAV2TQ01_CALDB
MPVFKLITSSPRNDNGYEVTRWSVKDSVDKMTWNRLIEGIQRVLNTRSTKFYLSWFDGTDYCTISDYLALQDAAQFMLSDPNGDGCIRIYVTRDSREPSSVFGTKPSPSDQSGELVGSSSDSVKTTINTRKATKKPVTAENERSLRETFDKMELTNESGPTTKKPALFELTNRSPSPEIIPNRHSDEYSEHEVISGHQFDESFHVLTDSDEEKEPSLEDEVDPESLLVPNTEIFTSIAQDWGQESGDYFREYVEPQQAREAPSPAPVRLRYGNSPSPTPLGNYAGTPAPLQQIFRGQQSPVPLPQVQIEEGRQLAPCCGACPCSHPYIVQNSPIPFIPVAVAQCSPGPNLLPASQPATPIPPIRESITMRRPTKTSSANVQTNVSEDERLLITLKRLSNFPDIKGDHGSKTKYMRLAIQTLRAMGFQQDEEYLKRLIRHTNGDLNRIIEVWKMQLESGIRKCSSLPRKES